MRTGQNVRDVRPSTSVSMTIFAVQKFVIKLFGGIVPGTLFLIGASLSLIPATYLIICFVSGVIPISLMKFGANFFNAIKNSPNNIWLPVFGIMATLTYVVGHLFYQRDPEKPDQRSFKIQSKKPEFPTKGIKDRVVKLREELACSEEMEVKVPYSNGAEKIGRGGLCHICSLILSKESDHRHYRNKNLIDLTKLHIKYHFPQKYRTIIRNEAHIQLTFQTSSLSACFNREKLLQLQVIQL